MSVFFVQLNGYANNLFVPLFSQCYNLLCYGKPGTCPQRQL